MSSVNITRTVFKRVGDLLVGEITFESTFNETEVRLDVAFSPALLLRPSAGCTGRVTGQPGNPKLGKPNIPLSALLNEVWVPLNLVLRPAGRSTITTTVTTQTPMAAFFRGDLVGLFNMPDAAMDARIDLNPDLGGSSGSIADQRFTA